MKQLSLLFAIYASILFTYSVSYAQTNEEVTNLVKVTKTAMEADSEQTIESIMFAEHPYKDENNPALYVFVLDTDLVVAAHPILPHIVGMNLKGKPDPKGKLFREEMLEKALKDGKGWVDYHYLNPKTTQQTLKISYFELANGTDGKQYIIGSGLYPEK